MMLQAAEPDDYVVATGESHSVREFLDLAGEYCGLDWKSFVETDPRYFRPTEVDYLLGDSSKVRSEARLEAEGPLRRAGAPDGGSRSGTGPQEQTLTSAGHNVVVRGSSHGNQAMDKDSRIFVAGHQGLVGSAICRRLNARRATRI